jgi:hypothetical protein
MSYFEHEEIAEGYRERMRRLSLFEPLFELGRSQQKDSNGVLIDLQGLGFLSLLFFFEFKLQRRPKAGRLELASYLEEVTRDQYLLSSQMLDGIALKIIETFRPTDGRKRFSQFFNWETKQLDEISYSILKDHNFDEETNRQYYTLDEDGLELIFATKEFYSEYQLSISQLMIRKQLEKGEYKSALRQISEMQMSVETLRERMVKLKHEILRNIVSEETYERYKTLLGDIHSRLQNEHEEFVELKQFVHDTRKRLFEKDFHIQEPKVFSYILDITKELEVVHNDHSHLLINAKDLITDTLVAAQNSLYYIGLESFNFSQDLVLPILSSPKPLDTMKGVLHPFFKIPHAEIWSPLTVLAEQNIRADREESAEERFIEPGEKDANAKDYLFLKNDFTEYVGYLLEAMELGYKTLEEVIMWFKKEQKEALFERPTFYHFWLYIHQRSPISYTNEVQKEDEEEISMLVDAFSELHQFTLIVEEIPNTIQVTKRYAIQNMIFKRTLEVTSDEN